MNETAENTVPNTMSAMKRGLLRKLTVLSVIRPVYSRLKYTFALILLLFISFSGFSSTAAETEIRSIKLAGEQNKIRIAFRLSGDVEFSHFSLSAPYRLVIDFENSKIKLGEDVVSGAPGFLQTMRFGKIESGAERVIIRSSKPFLVEQSFRAQPTGDGTQTIVFDLKSSGEGAFRLALAREAATKLIKEKEKPTPKIEPTRETLPLEGRLPRIVIDPGHGGIDGGASAVGRRDIVEKRVVLAFAKKLEAALNSTGEFDVKLTRSDDRFLSLSRRVEIARNFNADLFVSIHADSFPQDRSVRGATIYTLSDRASNEIAAAIAATENESDFVAGYTFKDVPDDVVNILFDLTRRETEALSVGFAQHMIRELRPDIRFFKNPHQTAAFRVLKVPDIPSALVELGFLSNSEDATRISSLEWRQKTAKLMAEAISSYLKTLGN